MPLNKLENFIKNTEGRILYVNPNDLDASDSIENQGNSMTKPFKTIQRALLESARFSYLRGNNNDLVEKTTILLFPGEHVIDNRPGFAIKSISGVAYAVSPGATPSLAQDTLSLTLASNFDLTQNDNILYKFNSVYGGVVVPRGTSIVGLDLRKTKLRPKYVPNPTDSDVKKSAIFKITGACYFWQFSIFDADESGTVYTDPIDFSSNNQAKPTFSHHKLTCFEYCDGVNIPTGYDITDLDMYYSKLSNAFNLASGRNIDQKYPSQPGGFAKQRPEWEIVGAFATDPINVSSIISGDGATPGPVVTVTTTVAHNLTSNTPIKVRGVNVDDYNVSTKVQNVIDATTFTYVLPFVRDNLPAGSAGGLSGSSATVTIETDTVSGASPYIFNCSLRSIWGMNGMHADGSKSSGFRSMVVAQFTAVSLQKDDRAFVKYDQVNQTYQSIAITKQTGSLLSSGSSSTNISTVYHLDPRAIYREGWQTTHIKISNDAFVQVVSVFAIGFNKHFATESGGDVSITNSNSNFGQFSLSSDGFKKEAFDKDNKAFITSIVTPRANVPTETNIDWTAFDVSKTKTVGVSSHLYLYGFNNIDVPPPVITQGYRIGARVGDLLYVETPSGTKSANIYMVNNDVSVGSASTIALGTDTSEKSYKVTSISNSILTIGSHNLLTGEKIRVISDIGDIPENLANDTVYYAIRHSSTEIKIASSKTNAQATTPINISVYGGQQLKVVSRVSDKVPGELGSPIQWDPTNSAWYIHANTSNAIYTTISTLGVAGLTERTEVSYIKRFDDERSLDEKLYKVRVVIPKELINARDPAEGFIIQESSTTGVRNNSDFALTNLTSADYLFNRNPRFITTCTYTIATQTITVLTDLPHNLKVNDQIIIKNVTCSENPSGTINKGYNGTFTVTGITNDKTFTYKQTDIYGVVHNLGSVSTNDTNLRTTTLPRFEKNDVKSNFFIYRSDVITPYQQGVQDGVYYVYLLNAGNIISNEFTSLKYTQNLVDLYPQLDKDNVDDNPPSAVSFAKRSPLGDVVTNDLKKSITRETVDKFYQSLNLAPIISGVSTSGTVGVATITFTGEHGIAGIVTYSSLNAGASHTPGTYYNVKLFNEASLTNWDGATAKVVVGGSGTVTSVNIIDGGSGYTNGETLYFDNSKIGGAVNASITIATSGISTAIGNVVQITGLGTVTDSYYRINAVPAKNQVSVAYTAIFPPIVPGQYVIDIGPSIRISSTSYNSTTGITTFTCSSAHGLLAGNKFRILDSSNNNLGDFIVEEKPDNSVVTFTAITSKQLTTPTWILKHSLSTNDASADKFGENYGTRGTYFFGRETLILSSLITNSQTNLAVQLPTGMTGTLNRFPLGTYIQIDNEIMRIVSSALTGAGNNEITVIRGVMGTIAERHLANSLIRKVKLLPIEFRRPSIMRASGHTFEYLGYGPGNYSTGLPQIQTTTLTEREEFLSQSQESSGGSVLYSGMNSNGDFFNGNTKTISSSGKVVSYDIPKPTVTGQDPSRLSVIYDEVIIKERLLVEGGNSDTILSQFDGPVTFNKEVKINDTLTLNGAVKVTKTTDSTSTTTGALTVAGGVGIAKTVNIGGKLNVSNAITPSVGNSANNGIYWPTNPGNGSGDEAFIRYYVESGENTRLHIGIRNDTDDDLLLEASGGTTIAAPVLNITGTATGSGNVKISPSTPGQARYHLYNGGGTAEWIFGQKTSSSHNFILSKLVSGTETDYLTVDTSGTLTISNYISGNILINRGFDFILGSGDQSSRGNSGTSRALVKDSGATLVLNYGNDFGGGVRVDSGISASSFSGSGASLTSLNASNLSTGTVPVARLGSSGTRDSSTFLRGDNTWSVVSIGNGTLSLGVSGTGLSGSASFTANQSGNATFTVTSNATAGNVGGTIVARDGSGNFSAGTITASLNGNASTAYGLNVHTGRNNEANKVVRTDSNGYLQTGYINSSNGDENNNSNPARVWGTNGSDSYLRTYRTSALRVSYADGAGNAGSAAIAGYATNAGSATNATNATNAANATAANNGAKAWVNFNGTNANNTYSTIYNSYNVSSVAKYPGSQYQVNYSSAFSNNAYTYVLGTENTSGANTNVGVMNAPSGSTYRLASSILLEVYASGSGALYASCPSICVAIFK